MFLFVVTLYLYTFPVCHSVSLGQRRDGFSAYQDEESPPSSSWKRIKQDSDVQQGNWRLVEQVVKGANVHSSDQSPPHKVRRKSLAFHSNVPKLDETGGNFAANSLSWAAGNVSLVPGSSVSGSEDGYQADFTG